MHRPSKFALALLTLSLGVAVPACLRAQQQQQHPDRPPSQPKAAPQPKTTPPQPHPSNSNTYHQGGSPPVNYARPPANGNNGGSNPNGVRNGTGAMYAPTPRQQIGVGSARPWVDKMRDLTPQQRERVMQNSRAFQNLSPDKQTKIRQQFSQWDRMTPQQQASLRENESTWRRLTPEQREHIKNDVLPKWRQMPWDRQQLMKQKLSVLQNMPEAARNERLNDPNFTRGMTDEEKSTLHDLSHLHVAGSPEPNPEQ